ncbi:30S ribosomal protein S16 [Aquimarina brevivitae]|uniref:Small ribosomal subunit protein bS16 n=1 Tax=Aquimarina brevivitae TaxID=323412 RepID=A0A4Q7PGV3_9FLAO|nr:30S ribosomal protein S16 [Aquimarina brevivitae]RZS99746.1 SSU ribosomal protein S16P [Aquimarina brevivitae]
MPVKIRLQRHGKKGKPFYWIVAADSRAKRDGKYLEKIGVYNPNLNPAIIDLNVDDAVKWLQNGAQPTDTARAILSYKGALLKNHLLGGVRKGALTEEQAEEKFQAWLTEKENAINAKKDSLTKAKDAAKAKALEAEKEVNAKREAEAKAAEEEAEAAAKAAEASAEEATEEEATKEEE